MQTYDPDNTGYVNLEVLKTMMNKLGHSNITDEDLDVLVQAADVDGDGRISIDDFAMMTQFKYAHGGGWLSGVL